MRSIRTLAVLAAFALAVLATLLIGTSRAGPPRGQPDPTTQATAAVASPSASYNPDATDTEHEDAHPETQQAHWGPVVDNFGRNFTNVTGGPQKWRQRLTGPTATPYITTEVAEQLKTVDTRNVPQGRYHSHELLKNSANEIAVKIDYHEGWALVLYLITDGTTWQIYAYDKWEP